MNAQVTQFESLPITLAVLESSPTPSEISASMRHHQKPQVIAAPVRVEAGPTAAAKPTSYRMRREVKRAARDILLSAGFAAGTATIAFSLDLMLLSSAIAFLVGSWIAHLLSYRRVLQLTHFAD